MTPRRHRVPGARWVHVAGLALLSACVGDDGARAAGVANAPLDPVSETVDAAASGGSGTAMSAAPGERGSPAGRYALVVGIADYPGASSDLLGPDNDARIFADLLVTRFGFSRDDVVVLLDEAATREAILDGMQRHLGQAGPDGLAVFFFSGHGTQLDGNIGLLPPLDDEEDGVDEALLTWGRGRSASGLLDDELGALSDRWEAGRALMVIDACYSGGTARGALPGAPKFAPAEALDMTIPEVAGGGVATSAAPAGSEGAAEVVGGRRRVLLAASRPDEIAWTADSLPGRPGAAGVFTHYLAEVVAGADAGTTLDVLMSQVRSKVSEYTVNTYGAAQTAYLVGDFADETLEDFLGGAP